MHKDGHELICAAIRGRVLLEFIYDERPRVVAPYCHGISTAGQEVVRAIQVRGASSSGVGFGKLWKIEKMADMRLLNETFTPDDPHYNPDDRAMERIHCRI